MKFKEQFKSPVIYHEVDDGGQTVYVIDAAIGVEKAAKAFSDETGDVVDPKDIKDNHVRFTFPPGECRDWDGSGAPNWFLDAKDKPGAKRVFVYEPKKVVK